jgi:hypothetical protein
MPVCGAITRIRPGAAGVSTYVGNICRLQA